MISSIFKLQAKTIYDVTRHKQQVLPLENVQRNRKATWDGSVYLLYSKNVYFKACLIVIIYPQVVTVILFNVL